VSYQAVRAVLEHSKAHGATRLVLLVIAEHANANGQGAYVSMKKIAAEAKVRERTVERAIERAEVDLKELGVLRRRGPHGTNMYALLLPGLMDIGTGAGMDIGTGAEAKSDPARVDIGTPAWTSVQTSARQDVHQTNEPSIEPGAHLRTFLQSYVATAERLERDGKTEQAKKWREKARALSKREGIALDTDALTDSELREEGLAEEATGQ
jgi:hypothetical protein